METKNDMFNQDNCVYQHSLNIDQPYQRQGWGEKLKHECHNNGGYYVEETPEEILKLIEKCKAI